MVQPAKILLWILMAALGVMAWTHQKPAKPFPTENDARVTVRNVTLIRVFDSRRSAGQRAAFRIDGQECPALQGCSLRCQVCGFANKYVGQNMQAWMVDDAVVALDTKDGKFLKQGEIRKYGNHRFYTFGLPIFLLAFLLVAAVQGIRRRFPENAD